MSDCLPPALALFLRALEFARDIPGGFRADDVVLAESAWSVLDTVVSSHGWVLALHDGRRIHVQYEIDVTRSCLCEEFKLTALEPNEVYPLFDDHADVFWYQPDFINRHLGITSPLLH